jgi:hypothetical protein
MSPTFLSAAWSGEAFHRLEVHEIKSLIMVDVLFLLDGESRREEKKKNCHKGRGFL